MNDLFVKVWVEGEKPQSTDVHWRCSTGRASWNYRLKFPLTLPLKAPEFARLHVQVWDKDVVKWNDVIGETQIDLYTWFQKAYRTNETVLPFKEIKSRRQKANGDESDESDENEPEIEDVEHVELDTFGEKKPLLNSTIPISSSSSGGKKVGKRRPKKKSQKKRDRNEAKEAISSFMDLLGMGRLPDDAEWLSMYRSDKSLGTSENVGKIAVSVQIVPEMEASSMPVGKGRQDPNVNPYLAPPLGRMKMSTNPFLLLKELVGPKLCAKLACLFCCVFCMGFVALFGAGIMSTLTFIEQQAQNDYQAAANDVNTTRT